MSTRRLGIVMNGVTGRMGTNQHLVRSLCAIRAQGGLRLDDGRVVVPDPILVGRNADKVAALDAGGADYVTKPIQCAEMVARVASHLRTARTLQSARDSSQQVGFDDALVFTRLSHRFHLTEREVEVLRWVSCGKTNKDIADILQLSPRTVNKHLEHIYIKLGVETRTAATSVALAAMAREG